MSFPMHDGSDTTSVTATGNHAKVSGFELDVVHDFVGLDVQPDGVVSLDDRIGVTDGPAVGGVKVGNVFGSGLDLTDTAKLVLSFLVGDPIISQKEIALRKSNLLKLVTLE